MKAIFVAFAIVALSSFVAAENKCMCNVNVRDVGDTKLLTIEDVFKNTLKVEACDDKALEACKNTCVQMEKEKTNGDLTKVSMKANMPYGDILCGKVGKDVEKKSVCMDAIVMCDDKSMKKAEAGMIMKDILTCKMGKFVKA